MDYYYLFMVVSESLLRLVMASLDIAKRLSSMHP